MRVLVLGGGVIGVTTAWFLAQDGYKVTVIDREAEVANGTSFANAGLVSPGHAFTWAKPSAPWTLLKSLFRDEAGQFGVAIPLIATFVVLSMALFIGVVGYALKTRWRPVVSGREEMLSATGVAEEDFSHHGRVRIHSESWRAEALRPVHRGQEVRVKAIEGLKLTVEPVDETEEGVK